LCYTDSVAANAGNDCQIKKDLTQTQNLHIIATVDYAEDKMGLDMYAYTNSEVDETFAEGNEIAYWRKHPNLHGWMEQLWRKKGNHFPSDDPMFNGIELELTWADLDQLEQDIQAGQLPSTSGFFFGTPADDYYREQDLEFIRRARAEIFVGLRVFYNSSW
jgi:hypothetical protein